MFMNEVMNRIIAITGSLIVSGCAQYTTSDEEREALSAASERQAQTYIQCVEQEAQRLLGISREASFIADTAKTACDTQLDAYEAAESELLETQYMMIDDQLEKSMDLLNERSKNAVANIIRAGATAAPVAAAGTSSGALPAATASQPQQRPVTGSFTPSFDQRVYMDCMQDQAKKYVRLSETAAAIAEVAASRCRTHLAGSNQAALEQEGRALVMGTVFDARLEGRP